MATQMWEIRITNVSDLKIQELCKSIGGKAIAVREGDPYDKDIQPHCHIYAIDTKSESYIRKQIQQLDTSRKGNALYSMSPSHENSPNYVLKKVYEDTHGKFQETMVHPRIIYQTEKFLELNYGKWFTQYSNYIQTIKQERLVKKKIKRDTTIQMIYDIADKHVNETPHSPNDFIQEVLEWHTSRELILPSRSNMERYLTTIFYRIRNSPKCLDNYYAIYFPN